MVADTEYQRRACTAAPSFFQTCKGLVVQQLCLRDILALCLCPSVVAIYFSSIAVLSRLGALTSLHSCPKASTADPLCNERSVVVFSIQSSPTYCHYVLVPVFFSTQRFGFCHALVYWSVASVPGSTCVGIRETVGCTRDHVPKRVVCFFERRVSRTLRRKTIEPAIFFLSSTCEISHQTCPTKDFISLARPCQLLGRLT